MGLGNDHRLRPEDRGRAADYLRDVAARGILDLATFEDALESVLDATSETQVSELIRLVAPPVRVTPPERRYVEPLEVGTKGMFANINLGGAWQVPTLLHARTEASKIFLDFTEAEFDSWTTEITAHADIGDITLTVPRGTWIQPAGTTTTFRSKLEPRILGFPHIKLSATIGMGKVVLRHPKVKRRERRRRQT